MLATVYVYVLSVNSRVIIWMLIDHYKWIIYVHWKLVLDVFVLDLKLIFNYLIIRSVQSWPQSHVTSKLRNASGPKARNGCRPWPWTHRNLVRHPQLTTLMMCVGRILFHFISLSNVEGLVRAWMFSTKTFEYQIMLMSCLQKKTKKSAKYRGRIHDYVPSK